MVRVLLTGTIELLMGKRIEAELRWIEIRVLARQHERGRQTAFRERVSDRSKLDGFGPGADDQTNVGAIQPSP